jgi:hypothetical protein
MAKTYDDDEEQFGGFGREAVEEAAENGLLMRLRRVK